MRRDRMQNMNKFFICTAVLFSLTSPALPVTMQVEKWAVFELLLRGPNAGNPFTDFELSATFINGDNVYAVDGFYDGDGLYKIRFMPDKEGTWKYITQSNVKKLSRKKGKFTCTPPSLNNHGPVHVHNEYHFRYADGAPFFQIGTTCYAWTHQGDEMELQTLATLAQSPFNKVRMCLFPKSYDYNDNEPVYYPFEGKPLTNWDFSRFNPQFWRHFEGRVLDLQRLGIEADIILFHPYDRWGFASMDSESDERYLRYVTARLSAYRNVWWSLANEYDLMSDKTLADWDRFFRILVQEDPYNHLRSIHNCHAFYDHSKSWVTHVSVQSSDMAAGIRLREQYKKPVIYDECQYEGDIPQAWGDLSPQEMTARFWLGATGGCYVGHGETYQDPADKLWWAKGGVLRGASPGRIAFFRTIMAQAPLFEELVPFGNDQGLYLLGKSGEFYLAYLDKPKTVTFVLAGERDYMIEMIDPWEMTITPIGSATDAAEVSSLFADRVYRFTAYKAGDSRLPVVLAKADIAYGSVPLAVNFRAEGTASSYSWKIDGMLSNESNTSFIFNTIGRHIISLTGRDANGASAMSFIIINALPALPQHFDADLNWPGSRDNLLFYWKQGQKAGDLSQIKKPAALVLDGRVTFSSDGAIKLGGGNVSSTMVSEQLQECKKTNQLAIEAIIKTDNLEQSGPSRIITFSSDTQSRNFTFGQDKENLVFRLRTPMTGKNAIDPQVTLCPLEVNTRTHIIVSYCDGNLFVYKNGVLQKHIQDIQGDFSPWESKAQFIIGDELSGDRPWYGSLYNVALYNRFITEEEARFKYQIASNKNDRQWQGRFF
ncbi:DUF5060 domain-containing protein [candidate division KSB1 bacterium]|nr:DUF5060 domain-containing protein [candidate division KSB1 bacterium]